MVAGSIPAAGARLDEHQRKLVFFLYPRALSAIRTFAITWLDTSETVFIGTSEFSKEILNFLSIRERFEPRVERISFFFSHGPVLNFSMACSTNLKASLANLIRLSIWSPVSDKSSRTEIQTNFRLSIYLAIQCKLTRYNLLYSK